MAINSAYRAIYLLSHRNLGRAGKFCEAIDVYLGTETELLFSKALCVAYVLQDGVCRYVTCPFCAGHLMALQNVCSY